MPTDDAPNERIVAILNPSSGSSDGDYRERIETALRERGAPFEFRETTEERDGKTLAREAKAEGVVRIMACGGDGTVTAVINGIGPNEPGAPPVVLIVVPGGTANLVAAALGVPEDVAEAVALAFDGEDLDVDLGRRDDTLFALGIGVGLTERLVTGATSEAKEKIGRLAYLLAMLKEVGTRPQRFELCLDGGERIHDEGVAVVIANTGEIGHGLSFAPNARLDDGRLDVCVLRHFGALDLLRLGFNTLVGRLGQDRAMRFYQAARVELDADPPLGVQIDGEPAEAKTPIVAEAIPKALRVRVPRDAESDPKRD